MGDEDIQVMRRSNNPPDALLRIQGERASIIVSASENVEWKHLV
jgi:hypothetical protein